MRCCVGDEGLALRSRPAGEASNHHLLRWLKTVVVSEVEKAHEMRQVGTQGPGNVAVCTKCPNMPVAGIWLPAWTNPVACRRATTWGHRTNTDESRLRRGPEATATGDSPRTDQFDVLAELLQVVEPIIHAHSPSGGRRVRKSGRGL
jgi:hypothetical protein